MSTKISETLSIGLAGKKNAEYVTEAFNRSS